MTTRTRHWRAILPLALAPFLLAADEGAPVPDAPAPAPDEQASFRTDGGGDDSLPWFALVPGAFPPPGSAHHIAGELIGLDHVEREFVLRADRTDRQNRSHFDLPLAAAMLPYGSVVQHGAPAALRDIPLGTHLHGAFYLEDPDAPSEPVATFQGRTTPEAAFNRCFRLEDDFSYRSRRSELWEINSLDTAARKLTATLHTAAGPAGEPEAFDLMDGTRVWEGDRVTAPDHLQPGQHILFNLTWATLYGPGRITEIWADDEARSLAQAHQFAKHHQHVRERGLPGWIDAVDNAEHTLTITFFGNVDLALFDALDEGHRVAVVVAKESLATYDPVNDRQYGQLLEMGDAPPEPGSAGIRVRVKSDLLLEGFRPGRIVRIYPPTWPLVALPSEEQFFGR